MNVLLVSYDLLQLTDSTGRLAQAGYSVIPAGRLEFAEAALKKFPFDVVVLDKTVPSAERAKLSADCVRSNGTPKIICVGGQPSQGCDLVIAAGTAAQIVIAVERLHLLSTQDSVDAGVAHVHAE